MNQMQKTVMWVGIALIVIMCLVPPWYSGYDRGYCPIFLLEDRIDLERLSLQCFIVAILAAGAIVSFKDHPELSPVLRQRIKKSIKFSLYIGLLILLYTVAVWMYFTYQKYISFN